MNAYDEIVIPFTDVYTRGGLNVFGTYEDAPGRTLIVVPQAFADRLEEEAHRGNVGAEDTLQWLAAMSEEVIRREGPFGILRLSESLDVAICDDPSLLGDKFSISRLEEMVKGQWPEQKQELITSMPNLQLKYRLRGLTVNPPSFLHVSLGILNEAMLDGSSELLAELTQQKGGSLPLDVAAEIMERNLHSHQLVRFNGDHPAYARVTGTLRRTARGFVEMETPHLTLLQQQEYGRNEDRLSIGRHHRSSVLGVTPLDMEQYLAMRYGLMNPGISMVFLAGAAGTGKTLITYVSALDSVLWYDQLVRQLRTGNDEEKGGQYKKIVLLKPTDIIGGKRREVGHLPGSLYEKIAPHLGAFVDAHKVSKMNSFCPFEELFYHPDYATSVFKQRHEDLGKKKIDGSARLPAHSEVIEFVYSGVIRGRSFNNTLVIVDEAQNYTPYEMKQIIDRMGLGAKIIILGDPHQLDNPECTREVNGFTSALAHYLGKPYVAFFRLTTNQRHQMVMDGRTWKPTL